MRRLCPECPWGPCSASLRPSWTTKVRNWTVTTWQVLCASSGRGQGWRAPFTEVTIATLTHTSVRSEVFTSLVTGQSGNSFSSFFFAVRVWHFMVWWRHANGYYQITGRMDDVINVSGHRLGTAEVEDALVSYQLSWMDGTRWLTHLWPLQDQHPSVAESAVVGYPHDIKGEGIYAYVTLKDNFEADAHLETELRALVRQKIAAYALPDFIQVNSSLSVHWHPFQANFSFSVLPRLAKDPFRKNHAADFAQSGRRPDGWAGWYQHTGRSFCCPRINRES